MRDAKGPRVNVGSIRQTLATMSSVNHRYGFESHSRYFPWQGVFALSVIVADRALGIYWFKELNMGHLILQRKVGERIAIGDDIVLQVAAIRGDKVRLAITAPKETTVHRMEIYNAIKRAAEGGSDE